MHRLGGLFVALAIVAVIVMASAALSDRGEMHMHGSFVMRIAGGLFWALLVIVFVGAVTGATGARRLARPLAELAEASRRVARGDLSARVTEEVRRPRLLRELMRTFNAMATQLQAADEQRRALLADVGHELRTPLAVLQGEVEAMLDGVHPADAAHLGVALEEIRVLERLVDDLRTLTLAEAGTLALHREPVDLGVLAADVAQAFALAGDAAGVRIDVAVPDDLPLIEVDPVRLHEVLGNLVANALHHAPAGTSVRLAAALRGDRMAIEVADAGPGIPADLLPRVFERFVKSDGSRGTGLGLAIARGLVEAHGGTIAAESGPSGTTMCVLLPVTDPR